MRAKLLITVVALLPVVHATLAQQKRLSKLEISKKETFVVGPENVLKVDTLILHDKATLQFAPRQQGVLEAKVAYVGKKCLITSKGKDGEPGKGEQFGTNGENGGDLSLVLGFEKLGSLTIDTRGGNGGDGANGKNGYVGEEPRTETRTVKDSKGNFKTEVVSVPGKPGTKGSDATMGGSGGSGGNIMFVYSTSGFIPIFNNEQRDRNSIIVLHTAGTNGISGFPGRGGFQSQDGVVRYKEVEPGRDGELMLVNADQEASLTQAEE
ncbi:hypothetical protein CLV24_101338 [Pontibacter ummariensis]|uniref:Collagen triple helix repeat-containing protein n=1 Tax=Pontibacter ummariensis TaxID=1610492 RepID=A0A239BF45_9BACT|nr:hypothetical protein [Pontibacter ummariensis]PRY16492.1 hypothetical protein CLV24_101338 [Pontibacter ummariensis]SNS06141.1 hypothetical protein SAMN06296052_101338 [Pontibacter ummariensis]